MPTSDAPYSPSSRDGLVLLVRTGALLAVVDGIFASALATLAYKSTFSRLWQGVASVLVGSEAFRGGTPTVLLGLLMHVGAAFAWSAVFLFIVLRWPWVRRRLDSPYGVLKVAALYGPFIWMVMSLIVIPTFTHRPPNIGFRWWVQLLAHIPFVAVPIAASARRW